MLLQLLSALGGRLGTPGLALSPAGTARLTAENGMQVDLECPSGGQQLHAFCVLRPMAGNTLQAWAPSLLAAQMMGHDTAGAHFMLDAQTGELLLGRSWDLPSLAADADLALADALQALAQQAAAWQQRLAGPRPLLAEPDAAPAQAGAITPAALAASQVPEARSLGLPAFAIRG